MLRRVFGRVSGAEGDRLRLRLGPVELELLTPPPAEGRFEAGEEVWLHTRLEVREDRLLLYGFREEAELLTFERLLQVSGVGPKVALALLGAVGAPAIAGAVASGDPAALTAAPGVGRRVAERIVLELRGKPLPVAEEPGGPSPAGLEAVEALLLLGFREAQVRSVVSRLSRENPGASAEELIRLALKELR